MRTAHDANSASVSSWMPFTQPRFDEFASCIVGPWVTNHIDGTPIPVREEVEEVMRSCGGAIQGIREIPLLLSCLPGDDKERIYHNRADGGFVYADDGSYSAGPEEWGASDTGSGSESLVMASLAFPNLRRLLITVKISDMTDTKEGDGTQKILPNLEALELSRPVSSAIGTNGEDSSNTEELELSQLSVCWERIQRVRMSNTDQDWSLARAKWEKRTVLAGNSHNDDDTTITNSNRADTLASLMGFAYIESIPQNADNSLFGDTIKTDTINLHVLAVCPASNDARSVVRCYDLSGSLKSVAFLRGSLSNRLR
jgi:hypothetical protein